MKGIRYFYQQLISPNPLSGWAQWIISLACLLAILLTAVITEFSTAGQAPILVASMGASAVILLVIPNSPLAQPWAFVIGQLLSGSIGVAVTHLFTDTAVASAFAVGLSVFAMISFRCLHPPGAATALAPVLGSFQQSPQDFGFLLNPLGCNVAIMLLSALLINRVLLRRDYPMRRLSSPKSSEPLASNNNLIGITQADIDRATSDFKQFLDISASDLALIFTRLQLIYFEKHHRPLTCGEIMRKDIHTVEYATEVEKAWLLMHEHHIKVLPVLDRARRVIGIVTRYDFLKNLRMTPYTSFQDKWLAFIKSSQETTTDKPEAIGHIMTRKVKTLPITAHIAELVPLAVDEGHHHIPIVDEQDRFIGLVFQSDLVAALFNGQLLQSLDTE